MSLADYKGPANTPGIFRHLAGAKVKACFQVQSTEGGADTYIVDESGHALVFHHNTGAYWRASKEDVDKQIAALRTEIREKIAALHEQYGGFEIPGSEGQ